MPVARLPLMTTFRLAATPRAAPMTVLTAPTPCRAVTGTLQPDQARGQGLSARMRRLLPGLTCAA